MDSTKNAAKMQKLVQYVEKLGADASVVSGWRCFEEVRTTGNSAGTTDW